MDDVLLKFYINVYDFKSMSDLVKYLDYLDKNDIEYNSYFDWYKMYYIVYGFIMWN